MARLDRVQKWMTFFGWTRGGGPGAVKTQYGGTVVGRHGDDVWNTDVISACIRDERDAENDRQIEEITMLMRGG